MIIVYTSWSQLKNTTRNHACRCITYLKYVTDQDILDFIFLYEYHRQILLKFVLKKTLENKSLFTVMTWTHTCVIRPQQVNVLISRFLWPRLWLYMQLVLKHQYKELIYFVRNKVITWKIIKQPIIHDSANAELIRSGADFRICELVRHCLDNNSPPVREETAI